VPDALALTLKLLNELGCKFPKMGRGLKGPLGIVSIAATVEKTTKKLHDAPPMVDDEKKWALALLDRLASYACVCDHALMPLGIAKAPKWTLKCGKFEVSAPIGCIADDRQTHSATRTHLTNTPRDTEPF